MRVFVAAPAGWTVSKQLLTVPNAPRAVSEEPRTVEFELRAPRDANAGNTRIPAYSLFNVCAGESGACLYRRKDIDLRIDVVSESP